MLRPPGGGSNICFGTDEEKPVKKNKMASSIFAEPEDPHAHRRNNPPGAGLFKPCHLFNITLLDHSLAFKEGLTLDTKRHFNNFV